MPTVAYLNFRDLKDQLTETKNQIVSKHIINYY